MVELSLKALVFLGALLSKSLATQLIVPSQDPWYSPPSNFASFQPGAILRVRKAPREFDTLVNNTAGVYQILFRSTDTRYHATWGVTTVFLPTKASKAARKTRALLSYQIPYNTIDVDRPPSYGLPTMYRDMLVGNVYYGLSHGWAVSLPDFEGPHASFSAGPQAGLAVIDSVRAVLALDKFDGPKEARYALWGYSGGAFASCSAAEHQASYAPELDFAGVAMGGITTNFTQIVYTVLGKTNAAVVPLVLLGLTSQYPEAREYLVSRLHKSGPYNATTFLAAQHMSAEEAVGNFTWQQIFDYFTNGDGVLHAPEMVRVVGNNWLLGYREYPILSAHVISDRDVC